MLFMLVYSLRLISLFMLFECHVVYVVLIFMSNLVCMVSKLVVLFKAILLVILCLASYPFKSNSVVHVA